jgi:hypothetical protein
MFDVGCANYRIQENMQALSDFLSSISLLRVYYHAVTYAMTERLRSMA